MSGTRLRSRLTRVFFVTLAIVALSAALYAGGPPQEPQDGRYIIQFHDFGPAAVSAVRQAGGQVALELPELSALAAYLPEQAVEGLSHNPNVKLIEVDPRRYPMGEVKPYGITMVQADDPAVNFTGSAQKKICIIDSGLQTSHEDLAGASVTGTNVSGTGNWFDDKCSHGTHVAGTIAAIGGNGKGVVGVMPNGNVNIFVVKVFGDSCAWSYASTLASALSVCRNNGANVVSMSLGGGAPSSTEDTAFANAYAAGVLSIAAAGNGGNTATSYPAGYSSVVSVAAVDSNKVVASFSQKNADVELAAPGVGVLSTVTNESSVSGGGNKYVGGWIDGSATSAGTSGPLADGGLCTSAGSWAGKVVLCQRGTNTFADKVANVKNGGGLAAAIYNNVAGGFSGTLNGSSTIPAVSLSDTDGSALLGSVGSSGTVVSNQYPGSGYAYYDGTSMATPHVSAVAALVWSHFPTKTNAEVRSALQSTAEDRGTAGRDTSYGYGIVRAKAAYDALAGGGGGGGDTTAPVISNVASRKTGRGGNFEISWTTDELSNSVVTFSAGTTGTFTNATLVTAHKMSFKGKNGVSYTYTVKSTDAAGNTATAGPFTHQN
jgi:serine protease